MTFRTELIAELSAAIYGRPGRPPAGSVAEMVDRMLAYRTTTECPTCGGLGAVYPEKLGGDLARPCPADCTDGRVPRDTPRLAIVESVSQWNDRSGSGFFLAPDLPEGTRHA